MCGSQITWRQNCLVAVLLLTFFVSYLSYLNKWWYSWHIAEIQSLKQNLMSNIRRSYIRGYISNFLIQMSVRERFPYKLNKYFYFEICATLRIAFDISDLSTLVNDRKVGLSIKQLGLKVNIYVAIKRISLQQWVMSRTVQSAHHVATSFALRMQSFLWKQYIDDVFADHQNHNLAGRGILISQSNQNQCGKVIFHQSSLNSNKFKISLLIRHNLTGKIVI